MGRKIIIKILNSQIAFHLQNVHVLGIYLALAFISEFYFEKLGLRCNDTNSPLEGSEDSCNNTEALD